MLCPQGREGSTPSRATSIFPQVGYNTHIRGVAQMARALALGARGRMFESCRPDK